MSEADVIVVGSGPGAVHAAWPLVERGLSVTMLDVGNVDTHYAPLIPERPWSELRRGDRDQHRYFLGDAFEGIGFGPVRVGAQLTPPRAFLARDADELLPVASSTFSATQSLAKGGLAAGWGAGVFPFADDDLPGTPFTRAMLAPHDARVAERIGVCGARDDLIDELGECPSMLPALDLDSGAERVLRRYQENRARWNDEGFRLGGTRLAVCSREHRGRGPHPYLDMDFWSDARRSVYRAGYTVDELAAHAGFRYLPGRLVETFDERGAGVTVRCRVVGSSEGGGEVEEHRARALVLGAGALGSARIALRSLGRFATRVPLLCNPYTYAPVVNLGMVGKRPRDRRHSLAQLTAVLATSGHDKVLAQYYSYRSLLLFKLVKETPLAMLEGIELMRLLSPVLGIVGIHHADRPSPSKTCALVRSDGEERLAIDYRPSPDDEREHAAAERRVLRFFRRLGCVALKRVRPGHGANIHYAGTLPFAERERDLSTDALGRLRGTDAVYVADGAVFPALPAKGLTFTLMSNADRVGSALAERLAASPLEAAR